MKMISNQVTTMCIFLAVNCCMIAWTPSGPSVMPSSFIKMDINKDYEDGEPIPSERNTISKVKTTSSPKLMKALTVEEQEEQKDFFGFLNKQYEMLPEERKDDPRLLRVQPTESSQQLSPDASKSSPIQSSGSNRIMEEMFTSLNKVYKERNQAFKEKFGIDIMKQPVIEQPTVDTFYCQPQQFKSVSQDMDMMEPPNMMEPQTQAKDIKVREVHQPLFCSGKELTPGAWELIRQSRKIYAGRGMIQDSYKQYNSQLAEELRMNHHFSNFTVEKSTGEKRKMAELSLKDFD